MSAPLVVAMSPDLIDEVALIHSQAFAGYLNTSLGLGYARAFLSWFAGEPAAIALASLDEAGRPRGYVVGLPLDRVRQMRSALLVPAALGLARHPGVALDKRFRSVAADRVLDLLGRGKPPMPSPSLPTPTMSLVAIGVRTGGRGGGHGRALLDRFEQEALQRRAGALRLSVYADNADARRFYERAGWRAFDGPVWPGYAMYYSKVFG